MSRIIIDIYFEWPYYSQPHRDTVLLPRGKHILVTKSFVENRRGRMDEP